MKNKSYKIRKLENGRFSIATDDLSCCMICGLPREDLHEVFGGSNRLNSMKYGLVAPLCRNCHFKVHNSVVKDENGETLDRRLKRHFKSLFESCYDDDFVSVFHGFGDL